MTRASTDAGRRRRRKWIGGLAALIAATMLLLVVGGCGPGDDGEQAASSASEQEQVAAQRQPAERQRPARPAQQEQQQAAQQEQAEVYEQQQAMQEEQQSYADEQEQEAEYEQAYEQEEEEQAAAQAEEQASGASSRSTSSGSSSSSQAAPRDTTFRDYARAGFAVASEDNTSTFSLDVDRTSYRLALNWAEAGFVIDPDSVRAEEWINAFNYRYAPPAGEDFFAITTDLTDHPLDRDLRLVRVAFQAPELPDDTPLNVTLVLDASGSMADGNRVEIARSAAESLRRGLRDDDRIAVVQFSNNVIRRRTVEGTRPDDRAVRNSINALKPNDSTNVQAGLDLGVELADEMRRERPDAYNYVILMSDGVANVDATDPFRILRRVGDRDDQNPLRLITIGVGISNYNDYLLEQLAQYGNGWYRYLSSVDEARDTFSRDNWLALSRPFADQTRAQLTWDAEMVGAWRMIGYENRVTSDASFTENRREFAEIPVGAATTVFFEVRLTDEAEAADAVNLGTVEVRWVTPMERELRSQRAEIGGRTDARMAAEPAALLRLGALVALAADRYSALPYAEDRDGPGVRTQLEELADEVGRLDGELGSQQAFRDFRFLIDHLIEGLPEDGDSGYSR